MGKGSSAPTERPLSVEELRLYETQAKSLEQATRVAAEQFNLSKEDREYVANIYRGDVDPNDPAVKAEVARRLKETPPPVKKPSQSAADYANTLAAWTAERDAIVRQVSSDLGGKGVDELLFEGVKQAGGKAGELLSQWQAKSQELGDEYASTLSGLSDSFKNTLTATSEKLGTADQDILSNVTGQNLAGISQSYQEALKQAQGALSRRGLAGSGVEAGVIGSLSGQQAMAQAGALSQSYQQAIALSDQRRQQQMGIAGQIMQTGASTAGQIYQTQAGIAGQSMQNQLNLQQQNLANLQMASGVSQGVFGMSQNYLAGAGQTANQSASTAGQTAGQIGQTNMQYAQMKAEESGSVFGALTSGAFGLGTAAILKYSDKRLKTNIQHTGNKIGQFNEHTWDWIEGHDYGYNKGVIAQEVMEVMPEAVVLMDSGYYAVNYSMIGE